MKAKIESLVPSENIVGIDVSKDTFDVCFLINGKPHYNKFSNSEEGFSSFMSIFSMFECSVVGFESTGVYHKRLEKYLIDQGVNPLVLPPRRVSLFLKSQKKIVGKTDKSDSYGIALYILKSDDSVTQFSPMREKYKPFHASLNLFEKQIRQTRNFIHSLEKGDRSEYLMDNLKMMCDVLEFQRDQMKKHIMSDFYLDFPEALKIKNEIRGIGDVTLFYVVPMVYDNLELHSWKQWVSYFGIAPVPFQSGTSINRGSHISHRGDNNARKALFMSAISSVKNNEIIKSKFLRMVANGKPKKKALIAIMSHILRLIISRLSHHTGRPIKK